MLVTDLGCVQSDDSVGDVAMGRKLDEMVAYAVTLYTSKILQQMLNL